MVTLTIHLPGSPPVTHVLKDETITVGRMAGNTLIVNDSSVSLNHAKITRKGGELILKDLNSTNGTFVNGQSIIEARLRHGDKIRFADIHTDFADELTAGEAAPAPSSAAKPAPVGVVPPGAARVAGSISTVQPAASRPAPSAAGRLSSMLVGAAAAVVVLGVASFVAWNYLREKAPIDSAGARLATSASAGKVAAARETSPPAAPLPLTVDQPAPDLPQLIKTLQDPDPAARRQAVASLHSMGSEALTATPALHQALSDPDQEVRLWAALTLINNKSYDKAIQPILVHELHDEKPMLRQLACVSLGLLPYEASEKDTVVPELVAAANNDADEDVRKAASSALGVIDPDGAGKSPK